MSKFPAKVFWKWLFTWRINSVTPARKTDQLLSDLYLESKWTTEMCTNMYARMHACTHTDTHTREALMSKHSSVAISGERWRMLDQLQLLNVNYSAWRRWGDNELAPGDSSDTSFNESCGNVGNLRSGTMRRYWLVRRSPSQRSFVLMKADTWFFSRFRGC